MIVKLPKLDGVSWEEDYASRVNPHLMTELLQKAVPVLKACDWRVTDVEYGACQTLLPLNQSTTNQHGTHQAALISLSADYTGGLALITLLTGIPMTGVHPCRPEDAASLWLVSMNIKYLTPSTGHLIGRCRIPDQQREMIVKRAAQGKRIFVTLPVEFESNGQKIAEAEMSYFSQPTIQLLEASHHPSVLFNQKIKASARMIAGVRASAGFHVQGKHYRIDCPYSTLAAGPQGELLASKLKAALPQLTEMVMARTQHVDEVIRSVPSLRQVVLLGAGLDMRQFRLKSDIGPVDFIEVDLPPMLEERERVIAQLPDRHEVHRAMIAADFIHDDIETLLRTSQRINPDLPTVWVYEGCSMYFDDDINRKMLTAMRRLSNHPDSLIWWDFVDTSVVEGRTDIPEVAAFLKKMDDLGESFIFGLHSPNEFLASCGLEAEQTLTVGEYRQQLGRQPNADPVLDLYYFNVARSK
ncbi:MAG TPA: SAM-dependent methyltransferase [Pirellulaceae bacterium]|nr:SAM-dependent methyltransferase [Pirellulaceae bacterium]